MIYRGVIDMGKLQNFLELVRILPPMDGADVGELEETAELSGIEKYVVEVCGAYAGAMRILADSTEIESLKRGIERSYIDGVPSLPLAISFEAGKAGRVGDIKTISDLSYAAYLLGEKE